MKTGRTICLLTALCLALSCSTKGLQPEPAPEPTPEPVQEEDMYGTAYVFDLEALPEVHINVKKDQWNELLGMYDRNNKTKQYVHCDATFIKNREVTEIEDAGLRLRGNTSRRRPEGNGGETHKPSGTQWHHCHFGLNFRKFVKDDEHEVHGCRKANLKWFKDDPLYAREIYCYDLFRRVGIWTAVYNSYCRLWLRISGDQKEVYYGVYQLQESIDTRYLKQRKELFGGADGNLWKCRGGAALNSVNADYGVDSGGDEEYTYELKSDDNDFDQAREQLKSFITALNTKKGEEFRIWITSVCDVELLLRTYAVNVIVGMWDDYWNNANNYYIYFNTTDRDKYKFFFIPYDYDNTLGTSHNCGVQTDSGRQDPLHWGNDNHPLIAKLLQFDDFRAIYRNALLEISDQGSAYFGQAASAARIRAWESMIAPYVPNDVGEDMVIEDRPAYWSNHSEYRLLDSGSNNFFKIKSETIKSCCK
ncbi:MAG: CotH kinase family protein [Bacteroidales bacterium]|nr:CotH kinase family protein [Bacteroidales bacterium]